MIRALQGASGLRRAGIAVATLVVMGCAQTPDVHRGVADPIEPVNRGVFKFNRAVDDTVVEPAADVYTGVTPDPVEKGIRNFFRNLGYVYVIANDLLQLELERALADSGRLAINTTVGIGGLLDPAADMGLPYRRTNFGVTAARWGLPPGPYLVLPLIGPRTLRGSPGVPMRIATNPVFYLDAGTTQSVLSGVGAVDSAAAHRAEMERVDKAISPYAFVRQGYIERQHRLIHGADTEDEPFASPFPAGEPPTTAPVPASQPRGRAKGEP